MLSASSAAVNSAIGQLQAAASSKSGIANVGEVRQPRPPRSGVDVWLSMVVALAATTIGACSSGASDHAASTAAVTTVTVVEGVGPNESVPVTSSSTVPAGGAGPGPTEPLSLTLASTGLGGFVFGAPGDLMIHVVTESLGAPTFDASDEFATPEGGLYLDASMTTAFTMPFGRVVCWTDLCATFGGPDPASPAFVGWQYERRGGIASPALTAASGVTVGSRWSDVADRISVEPGGCFDVGYGITSDGISLALEGGEFTRLDGDGNLLEFTPDPATVTVFRMSAGDRFVPTEGGC